MTKTISISPAKAEQLDGSNNTVLNYAILAVVLTGVGTIILAMLVW